MNLISKYRYWKDNRCSAYVAIHWLHRRNITPLTLVDAGANNSQWMKYLAWQWPMAKVISFEPQPTCRPLGQVHWVALGSEPGKGELVYRSFAGGKPTNASLIQSSEGEFEIHRLDEYAREFENPAVLKVDCEDHTLDTLKGASGCLDKFCCVVAEVWEDIFDSESGRVRLGT